MYVFVSRRFVIVRSKEIVQILILLGGRMATQEETLLSCLRSPPLGLTSLPILISLGMSE